MDSEKAYLKELERKPQATEQQITDWFIEINKYRNKIVEGNLKLVVKYAYQMSKAWKTIDVMDLIQEGNIGLIKAVDTFQPAKGYKFSTIATAYIQGYMLHYIRDNLGFFKLSTKEQRNVFDNYSKTRDLFLLDDDISSVLRDVQPEVVSITPDIQEIHVQQSPEEIYIKTESRANLRRKIESFETTLSGVERSIWKYRILSQEKTLKECCEEFQFKYPEAVRRMEQVVIDKAKAYFTQLDFIDIMGD